MESQSNKSNKNIKDFFKILFMFSLVIIVYIFKGDISYFITEKIVYKNIRANNRARLNNPYKKSKKHS